MVFAKNISLIILFWLICPLVDASDIEKETRLKNQIIDYILDGEPVFLKAGNHQFLSIFLETPNDKPKGAVILMHGRGLHPNWPNVIYPLRTGLPERGWHTLSIQMPVLDNESSFYDYMDILPESFPRINAAIEFLHDQGIEHIVLLAHSCSVHMAVAWLEQNPRQKIRAFIGIGMGSTDKGQPMLQAFPLEKFTMPILDIRGEHDYPAVTTRAPERWKHIQQAGNPLSSQLVVAGADHYFVEKDKELLSVVSNWLKKVAE